MKKFKEALEIFNQQFSEIKQMTNWLGEKAISENGLMESILSLEETSIKFKKRIKELAKRKEVIINQAELAFIAIVQREFLQKHYLVRGMAIEIKSKNMVDVEIFKQTMADIVTYTQVFPEIISRVFQQHNV